MKTSNISLFRSLVEVGSLVPTQIDELDEFIVRLESLSELEPENYAKIHNEYYKGLSLSIYSLADHIRGHVANLKHLSASDRSVRGLLNSDKMNILLLGETSAGKTSFLERLLGESCGDTGPNPITAIPVIHDITSGKSRIEIHFNTEFNIIGSYDAFIKFLDKYNFRDYVSIKGTKCENNYVDIIIDKTAIFLDFIIEANNFSYAFEEILWFHRDNVKKQSGILQYARLIDMPGTGGKDEHTDAFEKALKKYTPQTDAIIYLIYPDQGIPSTYQYLKELKKRCFDECGNDPMFIFAFQIENSDLIDEKIQALKDYITKDKDDVINNDPFSPEEREYFLKAYVLDARGGKKESIKANMAMAEVLRVYFLKHANSFYNSLNMKDQPREFDLLKPGRKIDKNIASQLYDFLQSVKGDETQDSAPEISKVRQSFIKQFCIKNDYNDDVYNRDLQNCLKELYSSIIDGLDSMLGYLSAPITKTIIPLKIQKSAIFDITKYYQSFYDEYEQKDDWQNLIYRIQTYHWLRLTYNGDSLNDIYAKTYADPLKTILKEDIDKLKRMKNVESLIHSFQD